MYAEDHAEEGPSPFAFMPPDSASASTSSHTTTDADSEPERPRFRPGTTRRPDTAAAESPFAFFAPPPGVGASQTDAAAGIPYPTVPRPATSRAAPDDAPPAPFSPLALPSARPSTSTGPHSRPLTSTVRPRTRLREEDAPAPALSPPASSEGLQPLVSLNKNGRSTAEEALRAQMIREEYEEDSEEENLDGVFAFMRPATPPRPTSSSPPAHSPDPLNATSVLDSSKKTEKKDSVPPPDPSSQTYDTHTHTLSPTAPDPSYFQPDPYQRAYAADPPQPTADTPPRTSALLSPPGDDSADPGSNAGAGPSPLYQYFPERYQGAYQGAYQTADGLNYLSHTSSIPSSLKGFQRESYPLSDLGMPHHPDPLAITHSESQPAEPVGPRPADFMYESHAMRKRKPQLVMVENNNIEDSPYIEVRCSVQSDDDTSEVCNTLRVWVIAFVLITVALAANCYWTFRMPSPTVTVGLIVLSAWPVGRTWAYYMPDVAIPLPAFLFGPGAKVDVNPGFWTMKEHALIAQVGTVCINSFIFYPTYTLTAIHNQFLWDRKLHGGTFVFGLLFSWSSALFGIALAGVTRRFLVQAASTIWPHILSISLLINILHAEEDPPPGELGRLQYFKLLLIGTFCWQWVPSYLFQGLSTFNWICWAAPTSVVANHLFGYRNGLALLPISLDWAQVSTIASPLIPPWWAGFNLLIAYVFFWIFLGSILLFTNSLGFGYFPLVGSGIFDKFGNSYDVLRVLDAPHGNFSEAKYDAYSPPFISYGYYLMYYAGLAMPMALLVHFWLHHHSSITHAIKFGKPEKEDIHAKLMARYPQVPLWVFLSLFPISFAVAVGVVRGLESGMPIYSVLVAFALCSVFFLPAGLVFAQTNLFLTFTNTLSELVAGYLHPGVATTNILFKTLAITSNNVGILFAAGMKTGHYMKIPPRVTFAVQTFFVLWTFVVEFGVKAFFDSTVHDLCSVKQINGMVCPGTQTTYFSSVAWGLVGPQRMFEHNGMYRSLYWSMLAGALLPIPIWLLNKRYRMAQFVSAPILLLGATFAPSFSPIAVLTFVLPNIITQWIVRRRAFKFWDRYQYITSAALDAGTTILSVLLFLTLELPKHGTIQLHWAGNDVFKHNRDYKNISWLQAPPTGFAY